MRIFIAISLPDELRKNFSGVQRKVNTLGKLKPVEKENLHLTLKFLGEVSDEKVKEMTILLEEKMPKIGSFSVKLSGIGVFPNPNYVRVIWVGVKKGREEIEALQKSIDEKLQSLNFKKDERFHPHFTLARVRWMNEEEREKLKKILDEYKEEEFGEFSVKSIEIMKSELTKKGPIYTLLKKIYI